MDEIERLAEEQKRDLKRDSEMVKEWFELNKRIADRKKRMLALLLDDYEKGK